MLYHRACFRNNLIKDNQENFDTELPLIVDDLKKCYELDPEQLRDDFEIEVVTDKEEPDPNTPNPSNDGQKKGELHNLKEHLLKIEEFSKFEF
jgi:hypothetical protein